MNYTGFIVPLKKRSDKTRIWFVSDVHLGTTACDEKKVIDTVSQIKEENSYWVDLGDKGEFINYTDKRFDPETLPKWIPSSKLAKISEVQAERYVEIFKPIAKQNICMLCGNHEESIRLKYQHGIHEVICGSLGVKALGYSALLNLFFRSANGGGYMLKMALRHGTGGGYYVGGKINRAILQTGEIEADIYASGHTHIKTGTVEVMLSSTDTMEPEPRENPKAIIIAGTYLRTYQKDIKGYGEKKAYRPTALGSPYLDIWEEARDVEKKRIYETKMSLTL